MMRLRLDDEARERLPGGIAREQRALRAVRRVLFWPVQDACADRETRRRKGLHLEAYRLTAVIVRLLVPAIGDEAEHADLGVQRVASHHAGELHRPWMLERERRRGNKIQRLVVALEPDRRIEAPKRERQRRKARRCPVDDEVVDLDRGLGRSAIGLLEMRRELAEEVDLVRPWPEQTQCELRPERRALRTIAIVTSQAHCETGDRERCRFFGRRCSALRRPSPPCAAQ